MFCAGADNIDARGIYTTVTEDVGKLGDILLNAVEHASEQMPQVVRKHLVGIDVGFLAQCLHITPDVRPADRLAAARDEDTT